MPKQLQGLLRRRPIKPKQHRSALRLKLLKPSLKQPLLKLQLKEPELKQRNKTAFLKRLSSPAMQRGTSGLLLAQPRQRLKASSLTHVTQRQRQRRKLIIGKPGKRKRKLMPIRLKLIKRPLKTPSRPLKTDKQQLKLRKPKRKVKQQKLRKTWPLLKLISRLPPMNRIKLRRKRLPSGSRRSLMQRRRH